MEQERVEIKIKGERFVVRTNNDEPEISADELTALAVRVEEDIDTLIAQSGSSFSVTRASVFAAFQYAVECKALRETNRNLRHQLAALAQDSAGSRQRIESLKRSGGRP
jgi:cell division protein ZapA (FtsZ GTPase activity inhibitor)